MNPNGLEDIATSGGIFAGVGGALVYGLRFIIRRTAKDFTEVRNDWSQSDYVKVLREDADGLRKEIAVIAAERNKAVAENGSLQARVDMIGAALDETKAELREAERRLDAARAMIESENPEIAALLRKGRDPILSACTQQSIPTIDRRRKDNETGKG